MIPQIDDVSDGIVADRVTLLTFALASIAAQAAPRGGADAPELRFLLQHLDAVTNRGWTWRDALPKYLERANASDAPLIALRDALRLTTTEMLAVALCAAVEDDVMVGRALAHVQAPVGGSRPTLGLIGAALGEDGAGRRVSEALVGGAAVQSGLLNILNEPAPLPECTLAVPQHLTLALAGYDGSCAGMVVGPGDLPDLELPPTLLNEARRQAIALGDGSHRALIVRTGSRIEGRAVASVVARALGARALFIETDKMHGLAPWAILRRLLPVFCFELGPGDRKVISLIPWHRGPVIVLCGPDGSVESPAGPALSWSLPVPARGEREWLWRRALGDAALAGELARDHRHGTGRIFHLGRLARHRAALHGRAEPVHDDVLVASWTGEGAGLDALAQPVKEAIPDEALVTTPRLREQLELLLERCRARDGLSDGLGASVTARYHPGVRALLVGPSGTGKTLAAAWLATRLRLPLYRVDLASVTSKYIGETEKNLAQLLARAEQTEVVLLFDEADSLFGKRTDVRDANDRFANAQTNYLLQRIEHFDGICLLTSNNRSRFDDAFSRRLDMIVEFQIPGPEERRALWLSHLGTHHRLSQPDVNRLAASAALCGGDIRNAVLTAAVLARRDDRLVEFADLVAGITDEYRKLGRQMPTELTTSRE